MGLEAGWVYAVRPSGWAWVAVTCVAGRLGRGQRPCFILEIFRGIFVDIPREIWSVGMCISKLQANWRIL